jgi:hypothetical protein
MFLVFSAVHFAEGCVAPLTPSYGRPTLIDILWYGMFSIILAIAAVLISWRLRAVVFLGATICILEAIFIFYVLCVT